MERGNNYRLLKLKEILFTETDDHHELSLQELMGKLSIQSRQIKADVRTIKGDLEILDDADFEIVKNTGKFGKILYSHQSRLFETYQLRLMIDAVLSARFITVNEKKTLIDKIKRLTSKHTAKTLPEPILISQPMSVNYEQVKLNIDRVHRAISEGRVLTYKYGKFNVKKEFTYNRDGETYFVEPYALIWQNDYYYLIGRYKKMDEMRHYRLDRIREIEISDTTFSKEDFHLRDYVNQSFHMFAGEEIRIKVRFHIDLVNVVLDRFGHGADIREVDESYFVLSTKANLSGGLVNWILTWGNKAKVLSPDYLVDEIKEKIRKMGEVYM